MAVNMGTAIAYLELDTSKFSKGFASAYNDLKVFGDKSATAEQKMKGLTSAFGTAGSVLSKNVTLPISGIGAAAVKTATEFESAMSEVKAISGATTTEFDKLKEKAIEMGAETKFSASDSAAAFKYMAMAGWDAESMLDGISGVMDLAAASGEDLASVSDIVTDALTAFGLQASDSAHFADVLAQASSKSNTNVGLMGETFKYVAPVAGALGYSIEDTAVAIGLMANSGIKGSQAGTALRSTLTNLANPVGQAQKAVEQLGISIENADGTMKPLSQTMEELRGKFEGMTEAEKTQYAAMLAGQEGMSGLLAIVNASEEDFQKLTDEINNSSGAADEMASIMMDNTAGAIEQLKGALESAGIIIGEKLTPHIRDLAEWITELVEKFNSLSDEQIDKIVKIGTALATIGPALLILSKVISVVSTTVKVIGAIKNVLLPVVNAVLLLKNGVTTAFLAMEGFSKGVIVVAKAISMLTSPIGLVIGIITTLAGVFVYLWNTSEEFRSFWEDLWESIYNTVSDVASSISEFFTQTIPEKFNQLVDGVSGAFEQFGETVSGAFDSVIEFFTETIPEAFSNFVNITIPEFVDSVVQWFEQLPYNIGYALGQVLGYIYVWGTDMLNWVVTNVPIIISNIVTFFSELPGKIWTFLTTVVSNVITWGAQMIQNGITAASNFVNNVITFISQLPSKVWAFLTMVVSNVISWGSNMISQAISVASSFVTNFINFMKDLPNKVWGIIQQIPSKVTAIGKSLYNAGKEIFNQLWNGIKSIGDSILDWVSGFASSIGDFVSGIIDGFNDIVSGANSAKSAAKSVDGSHANGLSYVPFDGYVAELHEGERVLTKQQNKEYNKNKSNAGNGDGDTFIFYNTKPDPYQYAKQMKRAKKELAEGF